MNDSIPGIYEIAFQLNNKIINLTLPLDDSDEIFKLTNIQQRRPISNSNYKDKRNRHRYNNRSFSEDSFDFTNITSLKKLMNTKNADKILTFIFNNIEKYSEMFINKFDYDVLTNITNLSKMVCSSNLTKKKYRVLETTVNEEFFSLWNESISTNILESHSSSWWKKIESDWNNLLALIEECLNLIPSTSWLLLQKTLKLLKINSDLIENQNHVFSKNFHEKLVHLIQKTDKLEKEFRKKNNKKSIEPEDDYRTIGLFPELKELVTLKRNFIRKNVVTGPYKDIAQYLDIHFRLLREDFLNPIREDVSDYLKGVQRRFFNIKVIDNVKCTEKTFNKDYVCYTLVFNVSQKLQNSFENNKKRLITGTLLIFSNDEFQSIFCGVVVNCNSLRDGRLLVSFESTQPNIGTRYKMIECTIFFEPYHQVLKVLQMLPQKSLSMSKYLINVQTTVSSPVFTDSKRDNKKIDELRKKSENLGIPIKLNATQELAFNAALSQEFVIIQGPPGTGKTYLGLEIAKSLVKKHGPILVVCYTNHALDQFLEGLVDSTKKLIRFGSQSKSMVLQNYTLFNGRIKLHGLPNVSRGYDLTYNFKETLRDLESELHQKDSLIASIKKPEGIICLDIIKRYVDLRNSPFQKFTNEDFVVWLLQQHPTKTALIDLEEINSCSKFFKEENENQEYQDRNSAGMTNKIYSLDISSMINKIEFVRNELMDIKTEKKNFISKFAPVDLQNVKENENFISNIDDPNYVQAVLSYDDGVLRYDAYIQFLEYNLRIMKEKLKFLKEWLKKEYNPNIICNNNENPFDMNYEIRWQTYKLWLRRAEQSLNKIRERLLINYRDIYSQFKKEDNKVTVEVLKEMDIVGMTSTCAARMHGVLEDVGFQIVIVEEAAEVLEAHILPLLTKHCKHLILLGDHQQLKPSTSDYTIKKDFNLGISLFERMVNNGIQCNTLNVQHRMRPDISALISPAIYPKLENHQSVYKYPSITGISKSLFFIDHNNTEENFGDSSKCNKFEAKFCIELAKYLIKVGYPPEKITILAAYLGQVATIIKEANFSSKSYIKVTAIDNFQGEENDIILLSLVRNNIDNKLGFLSIENRICVALSRAKQGLYILGNMNMLCEANEVWKSVKDKLTSQEAIGPCLPLKCMHETITTYIKTPDDFEKVSNGGCEKDCNEKLVCGHECQQKCHLEDVKHRTYKCPVPCNRCICETHEEICKKSCSEACDKCFQEDAVTLPCQHIKKIVCHLLKSPSYNPVNTVCNQEVTVRLLCGHDKNVECNSRNNLKNIKCKYDEVIELSCGHMVEKSCQTTKEEVTCTSYCKTTLLCGHKCTLKCHINNDLEHENYICPVACQKINLNCQFTDKHTIFVECGEKLPVCNKKVKKFRITCQHWLQIECHVDVNAIKCTNTCKKTLPCTHKCTNLCSNKCGPCTERVWMRSSCGHYNNTPCGAQPVCKKKCLKKLKCGHNCPRNCSEPCSTICYIRTCPKHKKVQIFQHE